MTATGLARRQPDHHNEPKQQMLAESYRTRAAVFALLVGPPRHLDRRTGMEIHAQVCDAIGVDDIVFKYQREHAQGPGERPFSIELTHERSPGLLQVSISGSAQSGAPVTLRFRYDSPASTQLVLDDFDLACNAVLSGLGAGWQSVLAEARLQGQVHSPGDSALAFLSNHVLNLAESSDGTGRALSFLGFKYEIPAAEFTEADQLENPMREIAVEVLRADPRCLYLEAMSQWPQVTATPDGTVEIAPGKIRAFRSPPSDYLRNVQRYLESVVFPLLVRED